MKKNNLIKLLAAIMIMIMSVGALAGCGSEASAAEGGRLILKVNPQVAVDYDDAGMVTGLEGLNADGEKLIKDYEGYQGKESRIVVKDLVALMNDAGYFKTDADGEGKKITLEIENGSKMPDDDFLENIVNDIKVYMGDKPYTGNIVINGESNYGVSDYAVSPYGDSSYDAPQPTTAAPSYNGGGDSGYDSNTNYDPNTNYDSNSDYHKPAPAPTSSGNSDYGNSSYDDGGDSGYDDDDDGDSGYDD